MRRLVVLIVLGFVGAFLGCAKEQTVDGIVAKITEASGGAEALAAVQDQVGDWDFTMKIMPPMETEAKAGEHAEMQGLPPTMPMKITFKRPHKIRFDFLEPDGTPMMSSVYDGESGWESKMGQTTAMNEDQLHETETMAATWLDGLKNYKDLGMTLTKLPNETVDNQEYLVLQSTDKYGSVQKYYINPTTYYVERQSGEMVNMQGQKEQMTMVFKDYKKADGLATPNYVAQYNKDGEMIWEATLKEVKFNTGVADDVFMTTAVSAK
ncbi:MAG: outer membrane lipoprotein carrier protein LolA [bacterium]